MAAESRLLVLVEGVRGRKSYVQNVAGLISVAAKEAELAAEKRSPVNHGFAI
jgi:hypothetical protein